MFRVACLGVAGLGFLAVAGVAQAQIGFSARPSSPVGGGFGNVLFPGTGIPRATGHIPSLSRTIRGVPPSGRPGAPIVYPVPVVVGGFGYGYGGYGYGYDPYQPVNGVVPGAVPNVTLINTPAPAPTVIINQGYRPDQGNAVVRDYPDGSLPEAGPTSYQAPIPSNPDPPARAKPARSVSADKPTIYLIAMKDGSVYSAYAFWQEGDTVHYVTTKHAMNMASVSLVDVATTKQLNEERGVDVALSGN